MIPPILQNIIYMSKAGFYQKGCRVTPCVLSGSSLEPISIPQPEIGYVANYIC